MSNWELDLTSVTSTFGEIYHSVKGDKNNGWERLLKDSQKQFFDSVTEYLEQTSLSRKTVKVPSTDSSEVSEFVSKYHPGYRIVDIRNDKVILEEDPSVKAFSFLNVEDGMVYRRGQTQSGPSLDVDRLIEDDPELFMSVSQWPKETWHFVGKVIDYFLPVDDEIIEDCLSDPHVLGMSGREIISPDSWTPEQAVKLKPYLIPGKISVRLVPPRKAKPSELESGEVEE